MIDRVALLFDLQKLLQRLEADLLQRSESAEVPEVGKSLRAEYERAKTAERTAQNYEDWRTDFVTQVAAAWVLSCVFVRFLEDNRLIDPAKIAGPDDRLERARDEHELYFRSHPRETDREYLLSVFDKLTKLPGTKDVFGEHNPIRELPNWLSGDAAGELLRFFQKIEANTGALVHDFSDPNWDTRFLGDLYQDLSEAARKKYALLQTPEFVEEFILDRTLNPALDEFGLDAPPALDRGGKPLTAAGFRMIDPACGSGHFLLGAFPRVLDRWQRKEPGTNVRELVQRSLNSIYGADVNPYAVAIARFRLLLAAMRASGITRLVDAPGFRLNLACGDSLLHAPLRGGQMALDYELTGGDAECEHAYQSEDLSLLKRLLRGGQYHAVVANPPYITPKDKVLNARYRSRFETCYKQYSLAVPFMQQIVALAAVGGFTGQITASSFSNSVFGRKLVRDYLPKYDLQTVIDTSKAYIPGHGTPSVIVFLRARPPVASTVRMVLGTVRDPEVPLDPSRGKVWRTIIDNLDRPGTSTMYATVRDQSRVELGNHPWMLTGGGAARIREQLESTNSARLANFVASAGFYQDTHADEAFVQPHGFDRRSGCASAFRPHVRGRMIRDWCVSSGDTILFPYDDNYQLWTQIPRDGCWSWFRELKTTLESRVDFSGGTYREAGRAWFAYHQFPAERAKAKRCLVFAATATHSHFIVADDSEFVFNRAAPVIVLKDISNYELHIGLAGVLNSSTAGLLLRQYSKPKGTGGIGRGLTPLAYEQDRQFECSSVLGVPIPESLPVQTAVAVCDLAKQLREASPRNCLSAFSHSLFNDNSDTPRSGDQVTLYDSITLSEQQSKHALALMIARQEELDWECYRLYGLVYDDLTTCDSPPIVLGQRAFEIVLARKIHAGEVQTSWFERHKSTPITELPTEWPDDYRRLVERRIEMIERDETISLIEQPEYKRRWNSEPWESQLANAARQWLLDRLESYFDFDGRMNDKCFPTAKLDIALVSIGSLADVSRQDVGFMKVGELYRDDPAFDVQSLVTELIAAECVPFLPVFRYTNSGLRKRTEWTTTWEQQWKEDAINARTHLIQTDPHYISDDAAQALIRQELGNVPAPPKYEVEDFLDSNCKRLRDKLDVPKERWISFPRCEGPDGTPVIAWAGYDHLQLAKVISAYYVRVQTEFGGTDDARLVPLLAGLIELLPWLKQWHNEPDPAFDSLRMGDYFDGFINEEARKLGKTLPEIKAWTPPARVSGRGRRRAGT